MDRKTHSVPLIKRGKSRTSQDSADLLRDLDRLSIRLEGGEVVELNVTHELAIPDTNIARARELTKAPARLAFWAYQRDRARLKVREKEREVRKLESESAVTLRRYVDSGLHDESVRHDWSSKTFGLIGDLVNTQDDVNEIREELNRLRYESDVLNSVTEAMEQKCFALRKLISFNAERDAL